MTKITQKSFKDIPKSYDVNYQAGKVDFQFDKGKNFKNVIEIDIEIDKIMCIQYGK